MNNLPIKKKLWLLFCDW